MNQFLMMLLLLWTTGCHAAATTESCAHWAQWPRAMCNRLHQIWDDGNDELFLTGYAWHNRYTYRPEKIRSFNEQAWGSGLGKGLYDERGNWHGLYAFAFLDSHSKVEPVVGYSYLKVAHVGPSLKLGAGYALLVTARPDILHNIPFPGALPWVSATWKRATVSATYIPGAQGAGNVLFILGKWTFDKL